MTARRDPDRLIHDFVLEGAERLHDQVYDAIRAEIEQRPQRVVIGPWRMPDMNKLVPIGLGAAAVVVALVIAAQLLGPPAPSGVGGAPTASPSSAPSPTAVPSVAGPSSTPKGLPEGPFVLKSPVGGPPITVAIPAPGWEGDPGGGVLVRNNGGDPPNGAAIIGPFFGDLYVYGDPCQWSTTLPDTPATTVDEAVAVLAAQASRDASAPVAITVGGNVGKSITLHVPNDAVFSDCDEDKFASWAGGGDPLSAGPSRYHQGPGQIDELWILNVDGQLIVVDAMYGVETSAEHLAELRAILESMTFE